jgi:hypothetical protein
MREKLPAGYIMEGEFINDGKPYLPGTSVHVKAGKQHSPHTTKKGCTVLVSGRTKPPRVTPILLICDHQARLSSLSLNY